MVGEFFNKEQIRQIQLFTEEANHWYIFSEEFLILFILEKQMCNSSILMNDRLIFILSIQYMIHWTRHRLTKIGTNPSGILENWFLKNAYLERFFPKFLRNKNLEIFLERLSHEFKWKKISKLFYEGLKNHSFFVSEIFSLTRKIFFQIKNILRRRDFERREQHKKKIREIQSRVNNREI